nr:tyrosine-type recombinase/integrase [Desulfobacula sp.]
MADRIGLNAGITDPRQKIVFHSCRHTFASRLVKNHTDIYVVKELLGHSELKQTSRYARNAPENLRDAVNSLSRGETNREGEGGIIPFQKLA